MKYNGISIIAITIFLLFTGCSKDSDEVINGRDKPYVHEAPFEKTILLYMVAENSLRADGYSNITKILRGCNADNLENKNILLYFDPGNEDSGVLRITLNAGWEVQLDTLRKLGDVNLASPEMLAEAIETMRGYQSESYDLVLWGHATNWLPADYSSKFTTRGLSLYAYGDDNGRLLEIGELEAAIPDGVFDLILFDACYMGSVEVAYELRKKAKNLIAAPGEIISYGFPYHLVMDEFLNRDANYAAICQLFYDYYNNMSGDAKSATIAWIDLQQMDTFAAFMNSILQENETAARNFQVSSSGVQNFDRQTGRQVIRDLEEYMENILSEADYRRFRTAMNEVILFERHTDSMLNPNGNGYRINRHCGMTIYPYYSYNYTINIDYEKLGWFKAVYR